MARGKEHRGAPEEFYEIVDGLRQAEDMLVLNLGTAGATVHRPRQDAGRRPEQTSPGTKQLLFICYTYIL